MSLINDMLRDLEARRSDDLKRSGLEGEIRPLPPAPPKTTRLVGLLSAIVVMAGAAAAAWWFGGSRGEPVAVPPAAAPLPAATSVAVASTTSSSLAAPVPMAGHVVEQGKETDQLDLRTATSLSAMPPETVPASIKPPSVVSAAMPSAAATKATAKPERAPDAGTDKKTAAIELKPVAATPRERADAEFRAAQGLVASGHRGEAIEPLRAAVRHDPTYFSPRQALIRVLLDLKRNDEAMAALAEGLEAQPHQIAWAISLARLQVDRGDFGAAERTLARSAPHGAASADYLGFHGHVQYRLGHQREAITLYQEAARLAPKEGRWWFGLAVSLESDGRAAEARDAFRRAMATGTLSSDLAALAEQRLH